MVAIDMSTGDRGVRPAECIVPPTAGGWQKTQCAGPCDGCRAPSGGQHDTNYRAWHTAPGTHPSGLDSAAAGAGVCQR